MRWLMSVWFRLKALVRRDELQHELDEEMAFHVEREARKYEAQGHEPVEARRMALVGFGGVERFRERTREAWGVTALYDLGSDVRFAWRQLGRNPAFSVLASTTLALGIGGTVAIASVVHGIVLRGLPVEDESELAVFWMDYNWRGVEFDFVRERVRAFESLAAYSNDGVTLRTEQGSTLLPSTVASAELFDVLGAHPLLGRTFRPGEDRPGAEPVVVLSYASWQAEFGGDPDIVGRCVDLDGRLTTVVGVMGRGFYFPAPDMRVWLPLNLDPEDRAYQGNGWLVLLGRIAPGAGAEQVRADLTALSAELGERFEYPDAWDKTRSPGVTPLKEYLLGDARPSLLLLMGAVGLVLLLACANVAALILTRTSDRAGEMSVRTALGADGSRLARQVITESVLLGVISGLAGTVLALAFFDGLVASLPLRDGFAETLSMDWSALVAALASAVGTGAIISLAPLRSVLAGDLSGAALRGRRQAGSAAGPERTQRALVVVEVSLAVVLVTGAGLLVRSVDGLRRLDHGVDPEGVLALDVLMGERALDAGQRDRFLHDLVVRASALPGVTSAGLVNRLPIRDGGWQGTVSVADRPDLSGERSPNAFYRTVTPGAFAALGAELVRGRGILPTDDAAAPPVAVVNETFARRFWGDEDPIGRTLTRNGFTSRGVEIVGVVRDIAVDRLVGDVPMAAYYPWAQTMQGSAFGTLVVRTALDPGDLVAPLRALVRELEPAAAIGRVEAMTAVVDGAMAETLRLRFFLGLFSAMGLLMGAIGVYGVVSYGVRRRTPEFGVRMALGARPGRLVREIVGAGMMPVLIGLAAGAGAALVASRGLERFLYGVTSSDPVALLAAPAILAAVGALAAFLPAWRAGATDPASALRSE